MAGGRLLVLLAWASGLAPVVALRARRDQDLQYSDCAGPQCLERYVRQEDGAFSWKPLGKRLFGRNRELTANWTAEVFNLTSQRWMTAAETDVPLWWHFLVVITPSNLGKLADDTADWVTLSLGRGDRRMRRVHDSDPDITAMGDMATGTGTRAAVLLQVPNGPVRFANDPRRELMGQEDMKVWSWKTVREHPERPEFAIELPMTKAAVKAMDAVQEITAGAAKRFVLTGFSKRGLVTYLAAAVDKRVKAIIPGCHGLNIQEQKKAQAMSYDFHTPIAEEPFIKLGAEGSVDASLSSLVDPAADTDGSDTYISRLANVSMFIMEAANDDFFLVDGQRAWIHKFKGPMAYFMLGNVKHTSGYDWNSFLPPAMAFVQGLVMNKGLPRISWRVDGVSGTIAVRQESDHVPFAVKFWAAETCPASKMRDFRMVTKYPEEVCAACGGHSDEHDGGVCRHEYTRFKETELQPEVGSDGRAWRVQVPAPKEGYRAGFVSVYYSSFDGFCNVPYILSTEVSVMPKQYPYSGECAGDEDECGERKKVLVLAQQ